MKLRMIKLAEITHTQQLQKHDIPRNTPEQRGERSLQGKLQDTGKKNKLKKTPDDMCLDKN